MSAITSWKAASILSATSGATPATWPWKASTATEIAMSVITVTPTRLPTPTDASLREAAVAGRPRGTLAKMTAVRTVVAMTNPAPTSTNGITNPRYEAPLVMTIEIVTSAMPMAMSPTAMRVLGW